MSRSLPNIIITGTPGTGKTSHCELLAERTGLRHVSVNQVVKDRECHEGWDEEYQSWIVDEDKVRFQSSTFTLQTSPPLMTLRNNTHKRDGRGLTEREVAARRH